MVSNTAAFLFLIVSIIVSVFLIEGIRSKRVMLIHKLYFITSAMFITWMLALVGMCFTKPEYTTAMWIWDTVTYIGCAFLSPVSLLIALTFVNGLEKLKKRYYIFLIVPALVNIVAWSNPYHGLMYVNFSLLRSEVIFGPFVYINGIHSYICMMLAIIFMLNFAMKNRDKLYRLQITLLIIGNLIPFVVSMIATLTPKGLPITATPISFIFSILLNGIAIYQLHLFDIKPIATNQVLDQIGDCYLLLSLQGLVISMNKPFQNILGTRYDIKQNYYLRECIRSDETGNGIIFNLLNAVDSSLETNSSISYEQAMGVETDSGFEKNYYIVDVTPLVINKKVSGFVVLFKDITQVKRSLQNLQNSQARMMERERLAFLGQMVGGLAHNLKTPIMSISGSCSAIDSLLSECRADIESGELDSADFLEIYNEIDTWTGRIRDGCAYMSDIITTVKGQAASAAFSETGSFTINDLVRRSMLLMRHELLSASCSFRAEYDSMENVVIQGDINNLLQVLNNLLSNAIYAQKQVGGGEIVVGISRVTQKDYIDIYVRDTGPGIDPYVRGRLLKEMTTSKGMHGTGLGLYISNAIIKGKFDGSLWFRDNPEGGTIFGFSIPLVVPEA